MIDIQATTKKNIIIISHYYILKPEDVIISPLFLFVFTYMYMLLWLTLSITQIWLNDGHKQRKLLIMSLKSSNNDMKR